MGKEVADETKELKDQQQQPGAAGDKGKKPEGAAADQQQEQVDEGFDVVEAGAATPAAGKSVPLSTHIKQKAKWKDRARSAEKTSEAKDAELELIRLENEQLKQKIAASQKKPMPLASDYEGKPAEFERAMREWVGETVNTSAAEVLRKAAPATTTVQSNPDDEARVDAHYERAAKLKASDFDEAENEVIGALGKDAASHIIALFDNSEAVMYALGKNPKKLAELQAELKASPVRAVANLTRYAASLQLKPRGKAPEPDSADDKKPSSSNAADAQKQLDRMRDEVHNGKRKMADVLKFVRDCKASGISVT